MLEILRGKEKCPSYFEINENGVIFISDKIMPKELQSFSEAYKKERCFFKGKRNQRIEIVKSTQKQIDACFYINNSLDTSSCGCQKEVCSGVLAALSEIFEINFMFRYEPDLAYIIQADKIYPALLCCIRNFITNTPFYFAANFNYFGDSHEKSTTN